MTSRKKKAQISVYLDPDIMAMLTDYTARREQSLSLIAEAAIASFLSPDDAQRREAVVAKRLDQIDRRLARMERDVGISVETMAVFIRFWLTTTPALPEPAAQAARAMVGKRYEAFITALGRRLAQGPKLRQEIVEDVGESPTGETTSGCKNPMARDQEQRPTAVLLYLHATLLRRPILVERVRFRALLITPIRGPSVLPRQEAGQK